MEPRDFTYWLQGFFEINALGKDGTNLTPDQIACIKEHLALVFNQPTANEYRTSGYSGYSC